jgi:hypothetical protein
MRSAATSALRSLLDAKRHAADIAEGPSLIQNGPQARANLEAVLSELAFCSLETRHRHEASPAGKTHTGFSRRHVRL